MRFVFVAAGNLGGVAIRAFEGGQANHCGIVDGDHVIDATFAHGVERRPFEDFAHRRVMVDSIDVALPREADAWSFLREQLGKGYDWRAIVGFFGLRDWSSDSRWYCSELCAAACLQGGLSIADRGSRFGVRLFREFAHAHAHAQRL